MTKGQLMPGSSGMIKTTEIVYRCENCDFFTTDAERARLHEKYCKTRYQVFLVAKEKQIGWDLLVRTKEPPYPNELEYFHAFPSSDTYWYRPFDFYCWIPTKHQEDIDKAKILLIEASKKSIRSFLTELEINGVKVDVQ